ncbi:hypothetical protein PAMA_013729 [Pampus argenteus]
MNVILLIAVIFTLGFDGLVRPVDTMTYNKRPCEETHKKNAYNDFKEKHILKKEFNTALPEEWKTYLEEQKLCNRPRQSFIRKEDEQKALQICQGSGWNVKDNLCVSDSSMKVYELEVEVENDCKVKLLDTKGTDNKYVTVACDKIENKCVPVHYETADLELPKNTGKHC